MARSQTGKPGNGKTGTAGRGSSSRTAAGRDAGGTSRASGANAVVSAKGGSASKARTSGGTRKKKKSGNTYRDSRKPLASNRAATPPRVRKEISGILLLAFGALLFMGIFFDDSAGVFGYGLRVLSGGLFGISAWFLPFLIFGQGLYRLLSRSGHPLWNRFFNLLLLMMLVSAMFQVGAHTRADYETDGFFKLVVQFFREGVNTLDPNASQAFRGGGFFGGLLGVPLLFVFQKAGAMVVLATLGIVVALIVTRISLFDAARTMAQGTADTLQDAMESSRRRREERVALREERLAFYEAQSLPEKANTRLKKTELKEGVAVPIPDELTGGEELSLRGKAARAARKQAACEEAEARERGARFIDVEPADPSDMSEEENEDAGPSMGYPASFVHLSHDVGDLRVGWETYLMDQEEPDAPDENEIHDPFFSQEQEEEMDSREASADWSSRATIYEVPPAGEKDIEIAVTKEPASGKANSAVGLPGETKKTTAAGAWEARLAREERDRRETALPPEPGTGFIGSEAPARPYTFPPLALLSQSMENEKNMRRIRQSAEENARKLERTLESFGIGAKVNHISVGPAITRYELQPAPGIKVSRIVNLTDDIALNLASSGVRIEAPIPGKAAIGVEVPNREVAPISLRSVLESPEFKQHASNLAVGLGKDISGEDMVVDLAKMPHVLIAGATGSGKSVCINSIVISLLYKASPEDVKLLMIDPKVVELGVYNGIPHLLIPVVTDPNKAAGALRWAVQEMVMRYKLFAEKGVRDLAGYNAAIEEGAEGMKLPQMVIIIDELADLMMVAPHDVEDSICRLAQMARAAGMHLVIATQRPSVNVITGVIKANVPSRIAFSVSSQVDSRTIIDMAGAEKLLGKGDMLYYPVGFPKPVRVKGAFITDKEVELVVGHVKAQMSARYDEEVMETIKENVPAEGGEPEADDSDTLLDEAVEALIDSGQASVSFIQRRFKVGYARAGRIIDQMAERGIISGYEGSKPRRVLITREMWNEMRMQQDIRATEADRSAEQQRMRLQSRGRGATATSARESAFVRRAMMDAEERDNHKMTEWDEEPPDSLEDPFGALARRAEDDSWEEID